MATRCIVYSRVSTNAQERDGTSLDTQERACLDFAVEQGWQVVGCIRDTASGFDLDRPGVDELRAMLRRGEADLIVSYAVDRLSRNQNHIGVLFDEVAQVGAKLEFVTERFEDTAIGRFILAARAFIAEVEREKIVERTMRGKEQRARSGRLPQGTGRGMYGYRYLPESGTREVASEQAQVVHRVFEDFAAGGSCHGIAVVLNREGVPAFAGGRWYALTVRRLLTNESYTGRTIYRRTRTEKVRDAKRGRWVRRVIERDEKDWIEIEGATPAIVPRKLFEKARARFDDPERRRSRQPSHRYQLRGRVRCAECAAAMVGHAVSGGRYHYYRCPNGSSGPGESRCESRYIRSERLEDAIKSALADLLASPERLLAEVRHQAEEAVDPTGKQESLARGIDDIEARQRRLVRLFTAGDLPEKLLAEESKELAKRREALEHRRVELARDIPVHLDVAQVERELPAALRVIRDWIESAEGDDLDLLLRAMEVEITASVDQAELRGSIPLIAQADQSFATIEQTSASRRARTRRRRRGGARRGSRAMRSR